VACRRCQSELPHGARFCPQCGAAAPESCPGCAAPLPPGARFCPQCGKSVTAQPETRSPSPVAYTPRHLAEKILTTREDLEGERKQVTILFADLKGSLEAIADRDPEDARRLLDPILERMMEAVHRYEGTVNQVMGDGIMALFGAPLAHEDHAVRACYAALRMHETVKTVAEEVHRTFGVPIHIRVGLNSGEVVVRSIGSDLRMDYSAVGQTTHLAARMEQMAMPGSILATANTWRLVEGYVVARSLGPRAVKGLDRSIDVWEVTGAAVARSRLHAAVSRGLTRFVGRDVELDHLQRALERAAAGHGQVVGVVGEAGVGKSRLYWEFMRSPATRGWLVLETRSASYGKAAPWLPVVELLRSYFRLEDADDARVVREKVTGKLLVLDEAFRPFAPAVLALLGVVNDDPEWQRTDPAHRGRRMVEAVKRILLRESQVQPLLVLCEDLHWIDPETQALLESLVDSLPTSRILLLVNYRPEYRHGWGGKTYYTQLRVDPLGAASAEALLSSLLGDDLRLAPVRALLATRTAGNPFFIEETVRGLVETGIVTGERGAYRLARPVETIHMPATVQAVLAARIDRLPATVKSLLQAAAVIGKDVPFALLEAVVDHPGTDLRAGLEQLQAAEFLYELSLFPDLEYTFKHALTLEVAYQSLLRERRRALHEAVLRALERGVHGARTERSDVLAHHAVGAEAWGDAARYLFQAGEQALAEGRTRAGASFYTAAIGAAERLEDRAGRTLTLDACLELWVTRISLGETEGLRELGERAEELAQSLGDRPRLAKVRVRQAQAMAVTRLIPGTLEAAIDKAREAAHDADPEDIRTRSYARFIAGVACRDLGRLADAVAEHGAGIALFEGRSTASADAGLVFPIRVSLAGWQSEALAARGDLAAGIATAAEALRIATELRHPPSTTIAGAFLGHAHLMAGDVAAAVPVLERGLAIAEKHDLVHGVLGNGLYLALALLLLDDIARGREILERALRRRPTTFIEQWTRYGTVTATARLLAGQVTESRAAIAEGLDLAADRKAAGYRAPLLRLEAETLLHEGDAAAACRKAEQALQAADALGMRPEAAHCHRILARSLAALDGDRAARHAAAAASAFGELGMRFWERRVAGAVADRPD